MTPDVLGIKIDFQDTIFLSVFRLRIKKNSSNLTVIMHIYSELPQLDTRGFLNGHKRLLQIRRFSRYVEKLNPLATHGFDHPNSLC